MNGDFAPSAPPLPGSEAPEAELDAQPALQPSMSYIDTYLAAAAASALAQPQPDTSSDAAIARAVWAADAEAAAAAGARPPPNTSLDHDLALQLHSDEQDRLCGHKPPDVESASDLDSLIRTALSGSQLLKLIPRLNPFPSPVPGSSRDRDRQRLLSRLQVYGLCEKEVQGDGNCQFRALSDQLYRTPDFHVAVRAAAVQQLARAPGRYAPWVPQPYGQYVSSMARLGTWGDHVTLQAVADAYGIKIFVVTSFLDNAVIAIDPAVESPAFASRALHLSFWAEFHYNSIYPASERGRTERARKVLGSRTLRQGLDAVKGAASWVLG